MSELVKSALDSRGVITVNINRPEIHNAFNEEVIASLTQLFLDIGNDDRIRLVVLTGMGKSFCAGADLNWMKSMVNYSEEKNFEDSCKLAKMFRTINECTKPVLGKINGHALGGGVGLVAVCDYAITHEKAKFAFSETRLGLIPAVISPFCIAKIGEGSARAWFLSGEQFDAQKALDMNLLHEVSALENFDTRIEELIKSFLLAGPIAAVAAKKLILDVQHLPKEELHEYTCKAIAEKRVSPEGQEGMNSLLRKRKASWMQNDG